MSDLYLYEQLEALARFDKLSDLPKVVTDNLSERIVLREYQEEAFRYFVTYWNSPEVRKNKQAHVLFHMATGAGKTVMMAGLIAYLYTQGYRKFLFFVNQTNILEKTKDNFLNPTSSKYLFAENLVIEGRRVHIQAVTNFAQCDPNAINLCFTTTQKLHLDLFAPSENALTLSDFEDDQVVLISDESHHINTRTKKASKSEEEEDRSWEYSVYRAFHSNTQNVLLEFTATADLKDKNVALKYHDKIVYDYPLAKFRDSGYTKDFQNLQSTSTLWERTLQALVMSEYRRALFADAKQNVKPVVLLKSQKIDESKAFYEAFFKRLEALTPDEILAFSVDESILGTAVSYFRSQDPTLSNLISALKTAFAKENAIIMNGSTDANAQKQILVNSLEEAKNPYRIIFTVDMLNEGWDVLNLFDIVRLYDTRQGGTAGKPGAYTIKEAQLIGRGARYFPYQITEEQDRFKRKYDHDITSEHRILETLLYHSQQDSKYIAELRLALRATGLLPEDPIERTYELKDTFKNSEFFLKGQVFSNKRVAKDRAQVQQMPESIRTLMKHTEISSQQHRSYSLFSAEKQEMQAKSISWKKLAQRKLSEAPYHILLAAAEQQEGLKFALLKSYFPNLTSMREFLTSSNYCGNITIQIDGPEHYKLTGRDWQNACGKALQDVATRISDIKGEYEGTKEFRPTPLRNVLRNKTIKLSSIQENGLGDSQNHATSANLRLDLTQKDWFVYSDNYGTSEEKSFVCHFETVVDELRENYEEIYLVRNERIAELAIYSFETGERFEPDFLLFLRHKKSEQWIQEQIYIEPKGSHLLEKDAWKEDFLSSLQKEAVPIKIYADNVKYRIIGLPFYNSEYRLEAFDQALYAITPSAKS